ncbi:MAG: hypothetical protein WBC40_00475 [Halobacteriota archaeon]
MANMGTNEGTFYVPDLSWGIEDIAKQIQGVKAPQDTAIGIVGPTDALNPADEIIEEIQRVMEKMLVMSKTVPAYKNKITLEEMREPIENWEIYNMLKSEISMLMDKVDRLERNITPLLLNVASPTTPEIVFVEEMSKETAKGKILNYIKEHKKTDIEELHKNIKCDIEVLVEVVDELLREGKIGED